MIKSLLLVCTGNICRSPMAAALFAERARSRGRALRVDSAGLAALDGSAPPEPVVALMARRGLDVSEHTARQLTGELASDYDLVLVMEAAQQRFIEQNWMALKGRVRRLGEWRDEDVPDPYGLREEFYADCLAQIGSCVEDWEERLLS